LHALLALSIWAGLSGAAQAAAAAGKVMMLTGQATALSPDGTVRRLAKNDDVFSGDLINSGVGSYVNIKFADGAFFLLRPDTRFEVQDYHYEDPAAPAASETPKPAATASAPKKATPPTSAPTTPLTTASAARSSSTSRAFFRLVKGGFRSVSGLIGKISREDYRVETPVATIGIRGTAYSADLCLGPCGDRSEISTQLRQAGIGTNGHETVLITTVQQGEIDVTTPRGETQPQRPGTVLFTTDTGVVTPVEQAPSSVQQDANLNPESCG
jgi:hypothetical protein